MAITWVVAADTTEAKIYALGQEQGKLVFVQQFNHPEGRLKAGDIGYDKPGQFEDPMHGNGKTFERANPHTVDQHHFAKKIADALEAGRTHNEFEKLIIVAGPHFHGILTQTLNHHLAKMVTHNIQKNYMELSEAEIYTHVIGIH